MTINSITTTNMAVEYLSGTNVEEIVEAILNKTAPQTNIVPACCDPNKSKVKTVAILYICTSLLSILGAGSIIICSLWNKIANSPEVHPLFHLTLANFLLALTCFVGGISWVSKSSRMHCFYVEVFSEMFFIMCFFLTVNYGVNVYIRLKERMYNLDHLKFSTVSTSDLYTWLFRCLYIACWVIPIVAVAPLIHKYQNQQKEMKDQHSCSRCLLLFDRPKLSNIKDRAWAMYDSILLIICLAPSIIILIALYIMTERIYRRCLRRSGIHTDRQRKSMSNMRKRIYLYVAVFIFCWTPALAIAISDVTRKLKTHDDGLSRICQTYIIQSLSAPLQGFLNSIVYGWTRKSFRRAARRRELTLEAQGYGSMQQIT